jgi:hypothetical protein
MKVFALILLATVLAVPSISQQHSKKKTAGAASANPEDCSVAFAGSARKAVKLRTAAAGTGYSKVNSGSAITVAQWFQMTCKLDPKVPATVPVSKPMQGLETQEVKLKGFLLAAKLDPDNDIHAEIAGSTAWNTPHLIVEVPPGQGYCAARKALWDVVKAELPQNSTSTVHVMQQPKQVEITGYVFLDTAHGKTDFCHTSGGRGVHPKGKNQQVQGLWEIHPVLDVKKQ